MKDHYVYRYGRYVAVADRDDYQWTNPRSDMENYSILVVPPKCDYIKSEEDVYRSDKIDWNAYDSYADVEKELLNDPEVAFVRRLCFLEHSRVVVTLLPTGTRFDPTVEGWCIATRESIERLHCKDFVEKCMAGDEASLVLLEEYINGEIEMLQRWFDGDVNCSSLYRIPERFGEDAFTDDELYGAVKYFEPVTVCGGYYDTLENTFKAAVEELADHVSPDSVVVFCYDSPHVFKNRQEAIDFFKEGMWACEGAERDRYFNIVAELECGKFFIEG